MQAIIWMFEYRKIHQRQYPKHTKLQIDDEITVALTDKRYPYYKILQLLQNQFPQNIDNFKEYLNILEQKLLICFIQTLSQHSSPLLQSMVSFIMTKIPNDDEGLQVIGNLSQEINSEQINSFFNNFIPQNIHLLYWVLSLMAAKFPYESNQLHLKYINFIPQNQIIDYRFKYSSLQYFRTSLQRIWQNGIDIEERLFKLCIYGPWKEEFWMDLSAINFILDISKIDMKIQTKILQHYLGIIQQITKPLIQQFIDMNLSTILDKRLFPEGFQIFLYCQEQLGFIEANNLISELYVEFGVEELKLAALYVQNMLVQ